MSNYNKKTWVDGDVIGASDLNRMENGIADAITMLPTTETWKRCNESELNNGGSFRIDYHGADTDYDSVLTLTETNSNTVLINKTVPCAPGENYNYVGTSGSEYIELPKGSYSLFIGVVMDGEVWNEGYYTIYKQTTVSYAELAGGATGNLATQLTNLQAQLTNLQAQLTNLQERVAVLEMPDTYFYLNGTIYEFEEGMTWATWLASDYNTNGVTIDWDSGVVVISEGDTGTWYYSSDTITSEQRYETLST